MKRLVLFDLDGTLIQVDGAGREAFRAALGEVYGETGEIDVCDFHGKTDPAIVRSLLRPLGREDGFIDRGMARLWEVYAHGLERELAARRERLLVLPGVEALLDRLAADRRFAIGLVTGNVEAGAWSKLRACGLAHAFSLGAFGSDSEFRADLPPLAIRRAEERMGTSFRPERVYVVGDTPADIECARASRLRAVAVATGRHSAEELAEHGPDAVLPGLDDLKAVMEVLGG